MGEWEEWEGSALARRVELAPGYSLLYGRCCYGKVCTFLDWRFGVLKMQARLDGKICTYVYFV